METTFRSVFEGGEAQRRVQVPQGRGGLGLAAWHLLIGTPLCVNVHLKFGECHDSSPGSRRMKNRHMSPA